MYFNNQRKKEQMKQVKPSTAYLSKLYRKRVMKMRAKKSKVRYELTMKAYSYILVLAMLATIIVTPLGGLGLWANAEMETICDHVHSEECYATPAGHVCSIETGCTPVYPMKLVETGTHTHDDSCYNIIVVVPGHVHDEGCYDRLGEELGSLICELSEGQDEVTGLDYDNPICGKTNGESVQEYFPDYEAEPDYWVCSVAKTLSCVHMNCTLGDPCLAEETSGETEDEDLDEEDLMGINGLMGINPMSVSIGDSQLTLNVADGGGGFVDVDDISNAIDWPLTTATKQIQILADFGPAGTSKDRTITVNIPRGYQIISYSAVSTTPAISGVAQIAFSSTDAPKVDSSTLTALDGTSWAAQRINGYTALRSSVETDVRVYDGKVEYVFNSSCDKITLTLTLGIDQSIMPHNATSTVLNDITVEMVSGTDGLSDYLSTTVTGLVVPRIIDSTQSYWGSRTIDGIVDPVDGDKGTIPEFRTDQNLANRSNETGPQNHLAESLTIVVSYPEGLTFTGFTERITYDSTTTKTAIDANTFTTETYSNGHLTVTLDTVNRTVTFEYTDVLSCHHASLNGFSCYWIGEVDNDKIIWGSKLAFPVTFSESSGLYTAGATQAHALSNATTTITIKKPDVEIRIIPSNRMRSDLNAYAGGNYPYDYMLGGFQVQQLGPSVSGPLMYEFDFPASLAVRGVSLPGQTGNDYSKVEVVTNTGRTIELATLPAVSNTQAFQPALTVDSETLGLATDEYLVSLKAWQNSLNVVNYTNTRTASPTSYFGRFQAGQEGDVTLTIYGAADPENLVIYATATDHTTIGWTDVGTNSVSLTSVRVNTDDGDGAGSFYPGGGINFTARYNGAGGLSITTRTQNDVIDPIIYICLPEGIDLDTTSVRAISRSGNHAGAPFALQSLGSKQVIIGGETWNVFSFTSYDKLDMVALTTYGFSSALVPTGYGTITVTFTANVSSAAKTYSGLEAQDIVLWDLGQTAIDSTQSTYYVGNDENNVAEKGITYSVARATQSGSINIVQKPGLNVSIGIRTFDTLDINPFFTYNGTRASIAPITVDDPAEIWLEWSNTDTTDFKAGSEIYLPIPKKGAVYDAYFNDSAVNPASGGSSSETPEWTGYLTGPVTLAGFTTYYTTDTVYITNPGPQDNSWVPVTATWLTAAAVGTNWDDVTMIKFVADADLASGASGSTTFTIDVDEHAKLGEVNFWRSYSKGWRDASGDGSWVYGSVIAAEPSMTGIEGMLFRDADSNGEKAASGENFNPLASGSIITAVLTEKNGGIAPLTLTMSADGSFKTLNENLTQYFLKTGEYTLTLYNNTSGAYYFTPTSITPAVGEQSSSDGTDWYMDVQQANIASNQSSATFTFIVDADMATDMTMYIGVGLRNSWTVTYANGTGSSFATPAEEAVPDGNTPSNNPVINASTAVAGYDPTTVRWTLDVNVTLSGGTAITAGTPITTTQLRQIVVGSNITATANLTPYDYTISYALLGSSDFASSNPNRTTYSVTDTFPIDISNPTWAGHDFDGWTVDYANTALTDITVATTTYSIPSGTTGNITLTANWTTTNWALEFDVNLPSAAQQPVPAIVMPADQPSISTASASTAFSAPTGLPVRTDGSGTYSFARWNTAADGSGTDYTSPIAAQASGTTIKLYAIWTFTLTYWDLEFDVNLPSAAQQPTPAIVIPADQPSISTANASTAFSNPTGLPVRTDGSGTYSFAKWNTAADGTGTDYTSPIAAQASGTTIKLYAIWTFTATNWALEFDVNIPSAAQQPLPAIVIPANQPSISTASASAAFSNPTGLPVRTDGSGIYSFARWNTLADGTGTDYTSPVAAQASGTTIKLYAIWTFTATNWNLMYNVNTPTGANSTGVTLPSNQTGISTANASAVVGGPTGVPTLASGTYEFAGWATTATGTVEYESTDTVPAQTSGTTVTLFAVWTYTVYTYTITYYKNTPTGEVDGTVHVPITDIPYGESRTLSEASTPPMCRDGSGYYTFKGWSTTVDAEVDAAINYTGTATITSVTSNIDLYAVWTFTATYWDLEYDANIPTGASGSGVTLPTDQTGISTASASAVTGSASGVPTIDSGTYVFAGWNTQADGDGTDYASTATVPAQTSGTTVTLYAQWTYTVHTYTITYYANTPPVNAFGGSVHVPISDIPHGESRTLRAAITPPMCIDGSGSYTFKGWSETPGAAVDASIDYTGTATISSVTSDIDLYAVWIFELNLYKINFDLQGGTGDAPDWEGYYGDYVQLPAGIKPGNVLRGYDIINPSILPLAAMAVYTGDEFELDEEAVDYVFANNTIRNSTLYAIWEEVPYTVTVNNSYATITGAGEYTINKTVTVYAGSRAGYSFTGWTVNAGGVTLINANSTSTTFTMPGNAVTVTANWRENEPYNPPYVPPDNPNPPVNPPDNPNPPVNPPSDQPELPDIPVPLDLNPNPELADDLSDTLGAQTDIRDVPPPQSGVDSGDNVEVNDEGVPLGELPQTGLNVIAPFIILMLGLLLVLTGVIARLTKQKNGRAGR